MNTPSHKLNSLPEVPQMELNDILNEIEEKRNYKGDYLATVSDLRDTQAKLVKALREAQLGFETIRDMAEHAEPRSSQYAKGKLAGIVSILKGKTP